jgi:hypothetical protein
MHSDCNSHRDMPPRKPKQRPIVSEVDHLGNIRNIVGAELDSLLGLPPSSGVQQDNDQNFEEEQFSDYITEAISEPQDLPTRLLGTVNRNLFLIWRSPDGEEGHYFLPAIDFETGEAEQNRYHFVAVRFLQYSDKRQTVSWCSSASCPGHTSRRIHSHIFEGRTYSQARAAEHLAGVNPTCPCGDLVIRTELNQFGGKERWRRHFQGEDKPNVSCHFFPERGHNDLTKYSSN